MIPSNPPSATTSNLPLDPPAAPQPTPSTSARSPETPPVKGALPYSRQDYEQLDEHEKTPELDFLILGKIPGGKQSPSDPPLDYDDDFNDTVVHCLIEGETEALNFLWRESGRDPGKTTVDLTAMSMDTKTVDALIKHCADQPSLKVDLCLREHHASAIDKVALLATEGKVNCLRLFGLSAESLERLAPIAGKIRSELFIYDTPISVRCEQQFAEALQQSDSLATLELGHCSFGDSQGKHFIEGMRKNHSITELKMNCTPLPTTPESGYGTLLANNPTLQKLTVIQWWSQPLPDMNAIFNGLLDNHLLRELHIQASGYRQENPEKLCSLLEKNRTLTSMSFPAGLDSDEAYKALTTSLANNTSLTTFIVRDAEDAPEGFASVVDNLMFRNQALANSPDYLQKAGRSFDPSGISGMTDPGALIAQHTLHLSSSRDEFETVMALAELSIREQERLAREANAQPAATTTMTTDATATITTTTSTITTTTTTPPSGSSSS